MRPVIDNFASLMGRDIVIALAILVGSALAGLLARWWFRWLGHHARKTHTRLDDFILEALGTPVFVAVLVAGTYFALAYLPLTLEIDRVARQGLLLGLAGTAIYAVLNLIDAVLRCYREEVAAKTRTSLDDRIVPVLRLLSLLVGGSLGVILLLRLMGIEHSGVNAWLVEHGAKVAIIVVLSLVVFFFISSALPRVVTSTIRRSMAGQSEEEIEKRSITLTSVLVTTGQVIVIAMALMMILSQFVQIGPLLAGVGVIGIAVGFGAQSLVKDVMNGLFIIMEGQYHVGDVVKIADISGLVESVNLRRTVLRDLDGIVHFVPNGEIKVASNFTKEYSRVNLNISVSYNADLNKAIAVANRVCNELAEEPQWKPSILKVPQVLRVDKLGDSGIDLKIVGDTKPIKQWDVMGEMRKRLKEAFDAAGIEIPWPHVKVYFGESPLQVHGNSVPQAHRPTAEKHG